MNPLRAVPKVAKKYDLPSILVELNRSLDTLNHLQEGLQLNDQDAYGVLRRYQLHTQALSQILPVVCDILTRIRTILLDDTDTHLH